MQEAHDPELAEWLKMAMSGDARKREQAVNAPHKDWQLVLIDRFRLQNGDRAIEVYRELCDRLNIRALESIKQISAQRRAEQEVQAEKIKAEEALRKSHIGLREAWQERISKRCHHIVAVFNGVFDLSIDADSILVGEVSGAYAAINSRGPGLQLSQNVELSLETSNLVKAGTWLELEEGGEEAEWAKAYDAENFLVWHMLSHLADGPALRRMLRSVPEFRALSEGDRTQACALALDAIALTLGEALYVHPDKRHHFAAPAERQVAMLSALCVQIQRILKQSADAELDPGLKNLFLRFYVQISAHRHNVRRIVPTWSALHKRLGLKSGVKSEQQRAFEIVYEKARRLDIFKLKFHEQRQSLEEE